MTAARSSFQAIGCQTRRQTSGRGCQGELAARHAARAGGSSTDPDRCACIRSRRSARSLTERLVGSESAFRRVEHQPAAAPPSRPDSRLRPRGLDGLGRDLLGEVTRDLLARARSRGARGSSVAQRSGLPSRSRSQHRVWKRQPDGGAAGEGTSPLRTMRFLRLRGSGLGHRRQQRDRVRMRG